MGRRLENKKKINIALTKHAYGLLKTMSEKAGMAMGVFVERLVVSQAIEKGEFQGPIPVWATTVKEPARKR